MYNLDEIKEFISVLESSELSVLEVVTEDGAKIRLEKAVPSQQFINAAPSTSMAVQTPAPAAGAAAPAAADNAKTVDAPIVGVFYAAASPGATPYVTAGTKVKKGETICIIEAMKCMNEIQAEEDCEIAEVLVKDGELVEFGQPLFKIK